MSFIGKTIRLRLALSVGCVALIAALIFGQTIILEHSTLERTGSIFFPFDCKRDIRYIISEFVDFLAVLLAAVNAAVAAVKLALNLVVVGIALPITLPGEDAFVENRFKSGSRDDVVVWFAIVVSVVDYRGRRNLVVWEHLGVWAPCKPVAVGELYEKHCD